MKTTPDENTREVEEYNYPSIEHNGEYWIRVVDHIALTDLQLQKAKEEERERIMRWTSENYSRSTQPLYAHVDLLNLQNFIRQPNQNTTK